MKVLYILDVKYELVFDRCEDMDENWFGMTDFYKKKIYIDKDSLYEIGKEQLLRETMTHEMIHAFMHESGIDFGTSFHNEEVVNWIARMFDKIQNAKWGESFEDEKPNT